jgi:glycosyltransferase involved in cell wall biosynthesis
VPVVYIGNCRKNKGVVEVHEVLKGRGYMLVTSGTPEITLPCPNFDLSYRDYCLLLKTSSVVVTMSKFREGWCRTAHEAMLCKTPVIGSGSGGMAELLEGGKQYICRDISELPALVEAAIGKRDAMGEDGYRFARELTIERFEGQWLDLVEEVLAQE